MKGATSILSLLVADFQVNRGSANQIELSPWSSPASSRLPWTGSRLHPPPVDSTPIPYSPEISQELGILQSAIERASQA
ncbi:hypothetical protein MCOR02_004614 [Pyricularia oryzae]|nr:hypothetical protein MCOR02_004614 [Pyricularia oryzae]KAI6523442.1 hypothetical protein MCOR16_007226 [Pyricularia oryzae]